MLDVGLRFWIPGLVFRFRVLETNFGHPESRKTLALRKMHFPGQHTRPGRVYIYIHTYIYIFIVIIHKDICTFIVIYIYIHGYYV